MSQKSRCVPGCSVTVGCGTLHRFPNPRKDSELIKTWVARKILELEDEFIFKNRKVCRRHFTLHLSLSDCGKLSKDAQDTADLLLFFDKLFDSLNGSPGTKWQSLPCCSNS